MKRTILGITILAYAAGACQQSANNTNTTNSQHANQTHATNANTGAMKTGGMDHGSMNHNSMSHGAMDHSTMQSSPNAASQAFDLQFIDTMMMHHQGAVDMAEMVVNKTQNPELKKFSQKIIEDQRREIAQMKEWREKWYAGKPAAMNMEMSGMRESMKMMGEDMKKMEASTGKDFDLMFLDMMTPHHEGATVMAREALTKAEHPEIKTLAQTIIREQEKEIKQMQDWKTQWGK